MFIEIIRSVTPKNGWISVTFETQVSCTRESIAGTSTRFRQVESANLHIDYFFGFPCFSLRKLERALHLTFQ